MESVMPKSYISKSRKFSNEQGDTDKAMPSALAEDVTNKFAVIIRKMENVC